ncbi:MAG: hypothetical protein EOO38_09575 [Cytophagaceae bacterium]|nr:MAG: hypothetical protein EOO38_09575 [Cytophagaceae bacterium]
MVGQKSNHPQFVAEDAVLPQFSARTAKCIRKSYLSLENGFLKLVSGPWSDGLDQKPIQNLIGSKEKALPTSNLEIFL